MNDPEEKIAPTAEQCVHFNARGVCQAGVSRREFFGQAEPCYGARVQAVHAQVVLTRTVARCGEFQAREGGR